MSTLTRWLGGDPHRFRTLRCSSCSYTEVQAVNAWGRVGVGAAIIFEPSRAPKVLTTERRNKHLQVADSKLEDEKEQVRRQQP